MTVFTIDLNQTVYFDKPVVACIGYFDGLHRGHQALVRKTLQWAEEFTCDSALITFDPDPMVTIRKDPTIQHLMTLEEKILRAKELGLDHVIVLHFTDEMCHLDPTVFEKDVLGRIPLKGLVCGFDFHYGYRGLGSGMTLKARETYPVEIIDSVDEDHEKISSTRIIGLVKDGHIEEANRLLGRPYQFSGTVIHGRHKGSTMGFPTANVDYSDEYVLPKPGVYAGYVWVQEKRYPSMINLGHNPTMNYQDKLSLEANLLGFSGDLYDQNIRLEWCAFIRPEKKFASIEELIDQLHQDAQSVEELLGHEN